MYKTFMTELSEGPINKECCVLLIKYDEGLFNCVFFIIGGEIINALIFHTTWTLSLVTAISFVIIQIF